MVIGKGRVERHGRFRTLHSAQDDLISEETHAAGAYRRHDGSGYCSSRERRAMAMVVVATLWFLFLFLT